MFFAKKTLILIKPIELQIKQYSYIYIRLKIENRDILILTLRKNRFSELL